MSLKEIILSMMLEALELGEAVEVRHDRYMRSHGKKARDSGGGSSSWMFTHKPMGDVDVKNKEEVHTAQGKFSDAQKSAKKWARENGHHTVYVMEEVQLDEGVKEKISGVIRREKQKEYPLLQNRRDVAATKAGSAYAAGDHKKGDRYMKWRDDNMKKEEVELDEISNKTLGSYIKKAASDIGYAAAADDTNKELKRHKGIAKAANKLTKEEVEQIDEISDEKKKEYIRAVADKGGILRNPRPGSLKGFDRKKDDALVKAFKGGSMQDYANLHKKSEKRAGIALNALNSLKKEEVELDEAKTDMYHKHMLKALGKTRLPKDHGYTSTIANNGDFVVRDGGGRVAGRIAKGDHDLK